MLINERKIFTFIFLYFLLISLIQTQENIYSKFKCNIDSIEEIPLLAKKEQIKISNSKQISEDDFIYFNIYLDLLNFEEEIKLYNLTSQKEFFVTGLNKAINTLQILLKVKPPKNYIFYDEMILDQNIKYWNKTLIGNQSLGMADLGIDLFIFVRFGDSKEMGNSTLGYASAKYVDPETGQPLIGVININKDIDYTKTNSLRFFELFILHEMTHVLGFSSYFFQTFFHNVVQKNDNNGIQRTYINSTKVVNLAKQYFNCNSIEGVELEDFEGRGKVSSHWESRILLGDYMNAEFYNEEEVISEFTLALLEETGFYKANYYTGGLMQFGKNKGCDFLYLKCVNHDENIDQKFEPSCSSGRQSRTYHFINKFNSFQEQNNSNDKYGGRPPPDYCSVSKEFSGETQNSYYVGRCSELGNGEYGTKINYNNIIDGKTTNYKSSDLKSIIQEKNSNNSFCILSSLISKNIDNYNYYSNTVRAVCYQMYCSDRSLTIQINNDYIVCPRKGGKIKVINFDGYLICPDYNLICCGSVLCNDLFDCIEKKSTLKNNIIYDYEIKTFKDLEKGKHEFSEESYEQSTNGKCPIYCSQCNEFGQCFKCKNDYGVVELKEKESIKLECKSISELNIGYYKSNETYYKCMDSCDKCSNSSECEKCKLGTNYINKKCIKIKNCKIFKDNGICEKCEEGYAFEENDKTICKDIDSLKEHFTKDNGNNYFKCDNINEGGVGNCSKCEYNNSHLICIQCKDNFILIDDENKCYNNETLKNNNRYHYVDSYHMKTCSKSVNNCDECIKKDGNIICQKCSDNYYFIKNGNMTCNKTNEIEPDEYYYYNKEKEAYCLCGDSIDNCKICNSSTYCDLCKNGFILIKDDEVKCQNISNVKEDFSKDLNNDSNDKICDIENCDICSSFNTCSTCETKYYLFSERNKCVSANDNHYFININANIAYSCTVINPHCETCNNQNFCTKCYKGYYRLDVNRVRCYNTSEFNRSLYYLNPDDDNNYVSCSYSIHYCESCDSKYKCNFCESGYIFLDDDFTICHNKMNTDLSMYFTEDNMRYYSCEIQKNRNNIQCFEIIKNQVVTLRFIQVQIIDNHLYVFMFTYTPFPKQFSLKLTILVHDSTRILRHLDEVKTTILTTNDDSDGQQGTLIRFTSDEIFNNKEVQINSINPNDDTQTKRVTDNNNFNIENFSSSSKEANTKDVKALINENKITDFSKMSSERNIINFNFDSTERCEINFISDTPVSFIESSLTLELIDTLGNIINAQCDTSQKNINSIKCTINEECDNDYTIEDLMHFSASDTIIFSGNGKTFKLICRKVQKMQKLSITFMVVIILIISTLLIVCVIYICMSKHWCRKEEEEEEENNRKNDKSSMHDISSSTSSRRLKKK